MTATPLFASVLGICVLALVVSAAFSADSVLEDAFGDIEEPTGLISGLQFVLDLGIGLGKVFVAIVTADFGWPTAIRLPFAVICDTLLAMSLIGLLVGAFT